MYGSRFYYIRVGMLTRCYNKKAINYPRYGGRGIKICKSWRLDFLNFKRDMYESYLEHVSKHGEKNTQIDRIDNLKNYSKSNCKWSTVAEQCRNRRSNIVVEFKGEDIVLKDLALLVGMKYNTLYRRFILRRWPLEKALNTPLLDPHGTPVASKISN